MLAPGTQLGPYEVVSQLSTGGMAHLFLARRSGPGGFQRDVVVKVVKRHLASQQDFVRMFLDEARIASRIHHPNVVQIVELGESHGLHFLVMEYVRGASLAQILGQLAELDRRLQPGPAAAIAAAAAAGLHAAHETRGDDGALLQVIHRDVSPQNILLGAKGEIKLIDFGIAKARGRMHQTAAGSGWKGKLRYMSPEQIEGRPVDRRVDVYALGVVLWEMLTMRRLFQEDNDMQVMMRIRSGEHPPPGAFVPAIPFALDALVLEMLHKDPDKRPQTTREVRTRLREAVPASKGIDDLELASLVWSLCADSMSQHFEPLSGSTPLNTAEMKVLPQRALADLTTPNTGPPESDSDALTLPASSVPGLAGHVHSYDSEPLELSDSDIEEDDDDSITGQPIELARIRQSGTHRASRTQSDSSLPRARPQTARTRSDSSLPRTRAETPRTRSDASLPRTPRTQSQTSIPRAAPSEPKRSLPWALIIAALAGTLVGAGSVTLVVQSQQEPRIAGLPELPDAQQVQQTLDSVAPELERCAEDQSGSVQTSLSIRSDGSVEAAQAAGPSFDHRTLRCMESALQRARFPPFRRESHQMTRTYDIE